MNCLTQIGISSPAGVQSQRIHFIGIGGAGMCGIAEVLKNQGYEVSGSDLDDTLVTRRLNQLGVEIHCGHDRSQLGDADIVVVSGAIPESNPELLEARDRRVPVVTRAEMLGELMRTRFGIAVAGTHGKTTATSFMTGIFQAAALDPTFVIGGMLKSEGRNAGLGTSKYFLAEADESDGSLLYLHPTLVVITNIDRDHMSTYGQDFSKLQDTFLEFVGRLPFDSKVVACLDDANTAELVPRMNRQVVTYGIDADADYRAVILSDSGPVWRYRVIRPSGMPSLDVELPLPGIHNVLNSLAAVAVAGVEQISDAHIVMGMREFSGVGRRFEVTDIELDGRNATLVDDYGHHPTEIDCVLRTIRQILPGRRVLMVYQPHRFSRTRDLFDEFVHSLSPVDELIMVDTYAACEPRIEEASARLLAARISSRARREVTFCDTPDEVCEFLPMCVRDGDVVVVQGAGNVSVVSDRVLNCQLAGVKS